MYSKLKFKRICTCSDIRQVSVTTFVQFLKIIQNIPILIYVLRLYYVAISTRITKITEEELGYVKMKGAFYKEIYFAVT